MVPTQNIVSEELPTLFSTLPTPIAEQQEEAAGVNKGALALRPRKRERSHLAVAMEIMEKIEAEIDESEIISDAMDVMNLLEDKNEVENAEPDLFDQSLTKLLKPRKKERHHFSMAEDILRDLDEEDGEW